LTMVLGDTGGGPPVSVAAVAARWVDRLQLLEVKPVMANSFSASLEPSRLAGRLSSQTRYSS
jgi:hypothetical protein